MQSLTEDFAIVMRKIFLAISVIILVTLSCTKDTMPQLIEIDTQLKRLISANSPDGTTEFYVLPENGDLDEVPEDPKNPLSEAKVALGKMMFYETGFAQDAMKPSGVGTYSCATCHIPEAGFYANNFQGIADGGSGFGANGENRLMNPEYVESELDVQSARPFSLVNVAYVTNTFWNGQFGAGGVNVGTEHVWDLREDTERNHRGFSGIETQNFEGLVAHRIVINKELLDEFGYTTLFDEVFNDVPEDERYNVETASLAFSAYIRSLITDKAPFQDWLKGDNDALSYEAKKGGLLFFGKAQCYLCHYNKNLGSSEFHALGVYNMSDQPSYNTSSNDRRNLGRGGFTLKDEDMHKFKVPGLYNVGDNNFFFHGASHTSLEDVIEYKVKATKENSFVPQSQMSEKFKTLDLSEDEKEHLVSFLREGLKDPELTRYAPTSILSGNCFPNNDFQSQIDLGCQ